MLNRRSFGETTTDCIARVVTVRFEVSEVASVILRIDGLTHGLDVLSIGEVPAKKLVVYCVRS